MLHDIHDADGNLVASIPLSDQNLKLLAAGVEVEVQYHTPKALQGSLGTKAGSFKLYSDGQIKTRTPVPVKEYANIQTAYRALNQTA